MRKNRLESIVQNSKQPPQTSPGQLLLRGLAVGFVATQALDIISMYLYENLSPEDRLAEDRARGGRQAYERMVKNAADLIGVHLNEDEIKYWGWKFHRSFGLFGGVQYLALREKYPSVGDGLGLKYGLGFYAVADQLLIYLTRSTSGPQNFSWKSHLRGAIAHIAWGVAAELTARTFDKVHEYEEGTGWALEEDRARKTPRSKKLSQAATTPAYV